MCYNEEKGKDLMSAYLVTNNLIFNVDHFGYEEKDETFSCKFSLNGSSFFISVWSMKEEDWQAWIPSENKVLNIKVKSMSLRFNQKEGYICEITFTTDENDPVVMLSNIDGENQNILNHIVENINAIEENFVYDKSFAFFVDDYDNDNARENIFEKIKDASSNSLKEFNIKVNFFKGSFDVTGDFVCDWFVSKENNQYLFNLQFILNKNVYSIYSKQSSVSSIFLKKVSLISSEDTDEGKRVSWESCEQDWDIFFKSTERSSFNQLEENTENAEKEVLD
jgi:hypothetical protein